MKKLAFLILLLITAAASSAQDAGFTVHFGVAGEFQDSQIRLEELEPGVKYYYRVCSQEILYYGGYYKIFGNTAVSPLYSFVTAKEDTDSFTALVFNDIHQRKHIFEALYKHVKDVDVDFVVFNGDCIDDHPVFVGGGKSMDNATVFILQKSKGKLKVKVINTAGEVLKEWED